MALWLVSSRQACRWGFRHRRVGARRCVVCFYLRGVVLEFGFLKFVRTNVHLFQNAIFSLHFNPLRGPQSTLLEHI